MTRNSRLELPPDALGAALAACLEGINAGQSEAEAVAAFPDLAIELRPLLLTARAVEQLPGAPVSTTFRRNLAGDPRAIESVLGQRAQERAQGGSVHRPANVDRSEVWRRIAAVLVFGLLALSGWIGASAAMRWWHESDGASTWRSNAHDGRADTDMVDGVAGVADGRAARPTAVARRAAPQWAVPAHVDSGAPVRAATATNNHRGAQAHTQAHPPVAKDVAGPDLKPAPTVDLAIPPTELDHSDDHEGIDHTSPSATPFPTPPLDPAATPDAPSVAVAGSVWRDDGTTLMPLVGLTVILVKAADVLCPESTVQSSGITTLTDAQGNFRFDAVAPDSYFVGASGGDACWPLRWHDGARQPGATSACDGVKLTVPMSAERTDQANIVFDASVGPGCLPTPVE